MIHPERPLELTTESQAPELSIVSVSPSSSRSSSWHCVEPQSLSLSFPLVYPVETIHKSGELVGVGLACWVGAGSRSWTSAAPVGGSVRAQAKTVSMSTNKIKYFVNIPHFRRDAKKRPPWLIPRESASIGYGYNLLSRPPL